jgi:threonyl-tRNA synthetase
MHRPVMIHRAPFGSMERFIGVLTEHCAGKFPLWLAPEQVAILPISDRFSEYAHGVMRELEAQDIRGFVDDRSETLGKKIRDTELKRITFMLIVGEKEAAEGKINIRKQGEGDKGGMSISDFVAYFKTLL